MPHSAREKWVGVARNLAFEMGKKKCGVGKSTRQEMASVLKARTSYSRCLSPVNWGFHCATCRRCSWNSPIKSGSSDFQRNNAPLCINNRRKRALRLGIHFSKILCTMLKWSPSLCNSYTTRFGVINNLMSSVGILFHFTGDASLLCSSHGSPMRNSWVWGSALFFCPPLLFLWEE